MEFPIPLNKFEKERRVIDLHKQGKTLRQIAPEVHMSFRDISKIIKAYDKKVSSELKENTSVSSPKTKKLSLSSQAFTLFKEGKELTEVAIILDIPSRKVSKFGGSF